MVEPDVKKSEGRGGNVERLCLDKNKASAVLGGIGLRSWDIWYPKGGYMVSDGLAYSFLLITV